MLLCDICTMSFVYGLLIMPIPYALLECLYLYLSLVYQLHKVCVSNRFLNFNMNQFCNVIFIKAYSV